MLAAIKAAWLTWKWVVILSVLCIGLAALNVWQGYRAITAPMRAENAALHSTLDRIEGIAAARNRDDSALLARLDDIAKRGQAVRIEYRNIAAADPLGHGCNPGQPRIDAVNRALGAQPLEQSP